MRKCIVCAVVVLGVVACFAQDRATIGIGDIINRVKLTEAEKNRQALTGNSSAEDTRAFQDMLSTALIKTRKFDVIERARLDEILKEQGLSSESGLIADGAQMGGVKGVDYLFYGAITQLGEDEKTIGVGGSFGMASKKTRMAVDIKIVDAHTGKAIIANSVEEESVGGRALKTAGYQQGSKEGDPLGDIMRATADSVVKVVVSAIYPVKVIAVQQDGTVMLNYGDGLITSGDVFDIFSQGESIKDPDTGEVLGAEENKVGRIQISSIQPKFSKGTLVEGSVDAIAKGAICRPVSAKDLKADQTQKKDAKKVRLPF